MFFEDRKDAGQKLAAAIAKLNLKNPVILALPRGGVPVASEVAKALKAPLDILITRKLGAPFNAELAMGAIVEGEPETTFLNEDLIKFLKVTKEHLDEEKKKQLAEISRQQQVFRGGRGRGNMTGKTIVLIDDGIATGASVHAALKAIRAEKPAQLILAVPVASPDALQSLRGDANEIVCLTSPEDFQAVGQFYRSFFACADEDVTRLLAE